jgi:putative ABC transport system permease protein
MNLLWRLSLRNLLRNQRRSFTTGTAIAAGFIGLSLLGAYIFRVQNGLQVNTIYINLQGHLQIHKKDSLANFSLTPKKYLIDSALDGELLKVLKPYEDKIDFQGKFLTGSGLIVSDNISQPFIAIGSEREVSLRASRSPLVDKWAKSWGKPSASKLTEEQVQQQDLISITDRIADILGRDKNGNKDVQLVTRTFENDMNAVNATLGLYHTTGVAMAEDTSIRLSLSLLQELMATDGYQYRTLFLKSNNGALKLRSELQKDFDKTNLPLTVYHFTDPEIGEFYIGTMNFLYVMGSFFVILICGMVSLSIVNSLTLGILERTKELGTLKALGFSSEQIVGLFVREAVWLSGFSILAGLLISQIVARIVNSAEIRFTPPGIEGSVLFQLAPDLGLYLGIAAGLFLIATVTAYSVSKNKMKATVIALLGEAI